MKPARPEDPAAAARTQGARLAANVPAKRLGTPEEFGQICAFLCSVHAGYMTGQNIPVDGGLYVSAFLVAESKSVPAGGKTGKTTT